MMAKPGSVKTMAKPSSILARSKQAEIAVARDWWPRLPLDEVRARQAGKHSWDLQGPSNDPDIVIIAEVKGERWVDGSVSLHTSLAKAWEQLAEALGKRNEYIRGEAYIPVVAFRHKNIRDMDYMLCYTDQGGDQGLVLNSGPALLWNIDFKARFIDG